MVTLSPKEELSDALSLLQYKTIGLFKNNYTPDMPIELVLSEDEGVLNTIILHSLGGYTDNHIPDFKGKYAKFPDGKNLLDMKKDPFALQKFIEDNFGKF